MIRSLSVAATLAIALPVATVSSRAADTVALEVSWQLPIVQEVSFGANPGYTNTVVDYSARGDGGLALFGQDQLIARIAAISAEPPKWIEVASEAEVYGIAAASDGGFFLTGAVRHWYLEELLIFKGRSVDAFVARYDVEGQMIWQTNLGGPGFQVGTDIVVLSSGDLVIAGSNGNDMLLWSTDSEGQLQWERKLGRYGGDIAALPLDGVAVVGREPRGSGSTFEEDAKLWLLDRSGEILDSVVVREAINGTRGAHYLAVAITAGPDAIVVSTAWPNSSDPAHLEIARYDLRGGLQWTAIPSAQRCETALSLAEGGDVLLACAEDYSDGVTRHLVLSRYAAADGKVTQTRAALPGCQQSETSVAIRVVGSAPGSMRLLGSRPAFNVGQSCTWLGHVPEPLFVR